MTHDREIASYLFEHARDIILVIDADDGRIVDANRAAELAYGYEREQLLALRVFDLRLSESPSVREQMRIADAQGILFETVHRRRDGSTFSVEVSSRGEAVTSGRRCLVSIIRDISDRKRMEHEREQLLATTQRALAQRDEFLVMASHELRTPLSIVSLQLQHLVRLLERATPREHLHASGLTALRQLGRLAGLIDTLFDAQLVTDRLVLQRSDVDLAVLVRTVVDRLRDRAEEARSDIIPDLGSVAGSWDAARIEQVVANLTLNAIKFGAGKPIRIATYADGDRAHLEVFDQGVGIDRADVARIFEKFERAHPSQYGGLGLGLYVAARIVHAHGGTIEVDSRADGGSVFRVTLPR